MAVAGVLLAVAAGLWLSPDVGPPVSTIEVPLEPVAPVVVQNQAPEVPAAASVTVTPRSTVADIDPEDRAELDGMGLPVEEWDDLEEYPEDEDLAEEKLERRREELESRSEKFLEAVDLARGCPTVEPQLQEQLQSLASMIEGIASDEASTRVEQGLSLVRAYEPRLQGMLEEGGCR